jgi:hypothetical protein
VSTLYTDPTEKATMSIAAQPKAHSIATIEFTITDCSTIQFTNEIVAGFQDDVMCKGRDIEAKLRGSIRSLELATRNQSEGSKWRGQGVMKDEEGE